MIKFIVVHCTSLSYKVNPNQFEATNAYHKERFNFISSKGFYIGYNYEMSADGTVRQARADGEETAAQIGHNFDSISIALDGNFDIEFPTEAQTESLRKFLIEKSATYNILPENIVPHRHFTNLKTCYGSNLSESWARNLILPINNPSVRAPIDCTTFINEKQSVIDQLTAFIAKFFHS